MWGGMLNFWVALDGNDRGREVANRLAKEFGTGPETFGFVCSPLVDEGHVLRPDSIGLAKVECATGKIVAIAERKAA